ncbi:MAG: flagellar hook-basal body complex protein FliE [Synergistaceae bacterium]|jgi:flagellar hook-basal body complex protein FliE|nr:flagellar hook-basal body complex protein FliE [Synergistaceae bacterium]
MEPLLLDMAQLAERKTRELKNERIAAVPEKAGSEKPEMSSFEELLSSSMKKVNALQIEADEMVNRLATGDVEDISEVVLASSRAEIALRMFMELRNKFVDAYQQLSRISA